MTAPLGAERRSGFFEAPATPPEQPRLRVDPQMSPARLSRAVIASAGWLAAVGSALLIVFNVAGVALPVVIGRFVDAVISPVVDGASLSSVSGALFGWLGVLVGLYLVLNLTFRFGGRMGWLGVQRAQYELSTRVLERVLDEQGAAGPRRPPGALLSLATADVRRACTVLYVVIYPPGEALGLAVAVGVLWWVHAGLGLAVLVAMPVVLAAMHLAARPLRRRAMREQAGLADAAEAAADLVAGYRVIRGLHAQGVAATRYRAVSRRALRATLASRGALAAFEGVSAALGQLFAVGVTVGAAALAFTGDITVGQLVTATGIAVTLVGPVDALVGTLGSFWAVSQGSARRLLDLLGSSPHPASLGLQPVPELAPDGAPELQIEGLPLSPGGTLDLQVHRGELVVLDLPQRTQTALEQTLSLAGPDLPRGVVRVRGAAITELRPDALRRTVLVAPRAVGLLAGTVRENVLPPGATARASDVERALRAARVLPDELAEGYATPVGEAGTALSGGQRQRIALARALATDPPILVLVEPTTSVDAVTEHLIATSVRRVRQGRTTVVVTGSPAFRAVADRIVVGGSADDVAVEVVLGE